MILSLLKTYAMQAALAALGAALLFAGVQSWRLSALQDKLDEQRAYIADLRAANLVNEASIEALRKANADWSAKCKAETEKLKAVVAELEKRRQLDQEALKNAKAKREIIYKESKDECATIPVPAGIIERLRK